MAKKQDNDIRSWNKQGVEYERILNNTGIELPTELIDCLPGKIRLVTIHSGVFVRITRNKESIDIEIYPADKPI